MADAGSRKLRSRYGEGRLLAGASKPRGKLKDAVTRCVFRPVIDASKCVCGRGSAPDPPDTTGGAYSVLPDPPSYIWKGEYERRNGKG